MNKNTEKQANVMLINTYPRFPHFYYILGENLGSLLHGDVSVMIYLIMCIPGHISLSILHIYR